MLCDELFAEEVTRFLSENRDFFAPYEPLRADSFYTAEYQIQVLRAEYQAAVKGTYFRYYFCKKEEPGKIIGTVSFSDISRVTDKSCKVGYKLAKEAVGCGYATEALTALMNALHESLGIHRMEADILEQNEASRRLVQRLGFQYEGVAKSSHKIRGIWKDHLRYSYIFPD